MKKIFNSILIVACSVGLASCDFDLETYQAIPTDDAFSSVADVQNGLNGAYQSFGTYRFYGNNVVAIGDLATDVAVADPKSGHGVSINRYQITDTEGVLAEAWEYGFKVLDRCVRMIRGANNLLITDTRLSDGDKANLDLYMAQGYALKALTNFYLVNLFGLPYQPGQTNSQLGLPLLDKEPLEPFVNIERATVEQTYQLILNDIASAKSYMENAGANARNTVNQFYLNEAAIYALEARVNFFMGKNDVAKASAQKAIELRASGDVSDLVYQTMWSDIAITPEDIFTIAKTNDDNLSANALNTLYGSYGAVLSSKINTLFGADDIRLKLIDPKNNRPLKFDGIPAAQAVSNIPVFRKSEMYLIIAEIEALAGNVSAAQEALLYTAKRNPAIKSASDLPSTKEALIKFISEENVREFFEEGHRWYDVRRTGEKISPNVTGVTNFDVSAFVFPIPADEINAGYCDQQNDKWSDALPK